MRSRRSEVARSGRLRVRKNEDFLVQGPAESGIVESASRYDELTGRIVNGMCFERLLAEGGMGLVYAVRRCSTNERFALKVIQPRHMHDVGIVRRFEREVRYAMRVHHPNVASVLEDGRLPDGRPYFVMDLYEGATLGALVRRHGPLSLEHGLEIIDRVLAGLSALHAAGIVHRDLQPDNVYLARTQDGAETVKIIDFGFAHEPGVDTGDGVTPDSPGSLVGTLMFMSPEQATRSRAITERSDLFAAGLLLYYALTGKLPFRGRDDLNVVVAIVRTAPIPVRKERKDVPRALDAILAKAFAKHPDARFTSAEEMRIALTTLCP